MFEEGLYPESRGKGIIVPLFKGGNSEEAKNYRGTKLNNIVAKLYSTLRTD